MGFARLITRRTAATGVTSIALELFGSPEEQEATWELIANLGAR